MITTAEYYSILVFQNYELEHYESDEPPAAKYYSVKGSIAICIPYLKAYAKIGIK